MKIDFSKSNIYVLDSLVKHSNGIFQVEGPVNCNGNVSITSQDSIITSQAYQSQYSIACVGNVELANGSSNGFIYYGGNISTSLWDDNAYIPIKYNEIPGRQNSRDFKGYLAYLMELEDGGTIANTISEITLTGKNYKSVNVFHIASTLSNKTILIKTRSTANSLVKIASTSTVELNSITVETQASAKNTIFAIDAPTLNIVNSDIVGTIYAPNSDVTLNGCTVTGAIYAKTLTIVGDVNVSMETFEGYIEDPTIPKLEITPLSSMGNYEPVSIQITTNALSSSYEIRYTLDGSIPTKDSILYSAAFELYSVGIVPLKVKLIGNGVQDGEVYSHVYGFSCKVDNPILVRSGNTYTIETTAGSTVYFTLDGSDPSKYATKYEELPENTLMKTLDVEGAYALRMIAISQGCDNSSIVSHDIIVELDSGSIPKPTFMLVDELGATVPNTYDAQQDAYVTDTSHTLSDAMKFGFRFNNPGALNSIKYTIDGSDPKFGKVHVNGTTIPLSELGYEYIRAFAYRSGVEFSEQIKSRFVVKVSNSSVIDRSENIAKSNSVLDSLQGNSSYAIDIAWVNAGVVTDDFAVYQALINILATQIFERIFNPTFGVSITRMLAEIDINTKNEDIIDTLKREIEAQDARIYVDGSTSLAYHDEDIQAVVVVLYWTNRLTNNEAVLKYAYDLDTVL